MNVIGPPTKKVENLLLLEIVVIGQSSSNCPGSKSGTVTEFFSKSMKGYTVKEFKDLFVQKEFKPLMKWRRHSSKIIFNRILLKTPYDTEKQYRGPDHLARNQTARVFKEFKGLPAKFTHVKQYKL